MKYILDKTGFVVGKNAEDNWRIIQNAEKDYYWIHAEGIPSAHIIIEIDQPIESEIQYACNLCKKHSKIQNDSVKYVMTQVSNIKLGSKPGEVYFKNNKLTNIISLQVA